MKKQQLRIGNFVTYKCDIYSIASIHEDYNVRLFLYDRESKKFSNESIGFYNISEIDEVELKSEQTMFDFGFKYVKEDKAYRALCDKSYIIHPNLSIMSEIMFSMDQFIDCSVRGKTIKRFYHVHQLQNFFFDLTGYELTWQPEYK